MLFMSFWHISSNNLSEGAFYKRRLTTEDARVLVTRSRQEKKLLCVAKADLAAPYEQREWKRHVELCQALSALSIPVSINDFFGETCSNALQFACVGTSNDLLVVDCSYGIADPCRAEYRPNPGDRGRQGLMCWSSLFTIDGSTITFDLYSVRDVGINQPEYTLPS